MKYYFLTGNIAAAAVHHNDEIGNFALPLPLARAIQFSGDALHKIGVIPAFIAGIHGAAVSQVREC